MMCTQTKKHEPYEAQVLACTCFSEMNWWCWQVTAISGECNGTCAALRAGSRGAVSMSTSTRHLVGVSCLWAHALQVSGMLRTDLRHLIYGCWNMEFLENSLGGAAGSRANGFGAACQVFVWHSVGCTMSFVILFLRRITAKLSEVIWSLYYDTLDFPLQWIKTN